MAVEGSLANVQEVIDAIPVIVKTAFPEVKTFIIGMNNITDITRPTIYIAFSPLTFAETPDDVIGTKTCNFTFGVIYEYDPDEVDNTLADNIYKFGMEVATTLTNALFSSTELNTLCLFRDLESIDCEYVDEANSSYNAIEVVYSVRIEVSVYNV